MYYTNRIVLLFISFFIFNIDADSISNKRPLSQFYSNDQKPVRLKTPSINVLSKNKPQIKSNLVAIKKPRVIKSKKEVIYYDKPDVVNKEQIHNQRRYYKPNYVKSHSRYCDPYWRKPFKSISFGFDI